MILIGLAGLAGSGKNFLADQITAKYESVKQIAFADPLKQMVHHMFGVPLEDCYTEAGKNKATWYQWMNWAGTCAWPDVDPNHYMTTRELLQYVGTELVRKWWCEDHWVKLAEHRIKSSPEDVVVVTDVRFQNEADLVTGMGGTILRVAGRQSIAVPKHVSEAQSFTVAAIIDNNMGRTSAQLMEQVEACVPGLSGVGQRPS